MSSQESESTHDIEDEHKAMLERRKILESSVQSLPEFMAEMRDIVKRLPTQNDFDVMIKTNFNEYDKALKTTLNEVFGKFNDRLSALETKPATAQQQGGVFGTIVDLVDKVTSGKITIPGLNLGGSGLENDITVLEKEYLQRLRVNYRYWLSDRLNSIGVPSGSGMVDVTPLSKVTDVATQGALTHK